MATCGMNIRVHSKLIISQPVIHKDCQSWYLDIILLFIIHTCKISTVEYQAVTGDLDLWYSYVFIN